MPAFASEGSGQGQLDVKGNRNPVSYKLIAKSGEDGRHSIEVIVEAPRDWLLQQGFEREAVLTRQNGESIAVTRDGLSVEDNIAVVLQGHDERSGDADSILFAYPELGA